MALTTGLQLTYGIQPVNPVPTDSWSGPYEGNTVADAINAANASIPSNIRFKSMEVRLIVNGVSRKFWYKNGTTDGDLIECASNEYTHTNFLPLTGGTISQSLKFATGTTESNGIIFGTDTNLYRSAADTLRTDDKLVVNNLPDNTNSNSIIVQNANQLEKRSINQRVWDTNASFVSGGFTNNAIVKGNGTNGLVNSVITENASGFIGINNANPSERLDVTGNIRATDLTLTGNLSVLGTTTQIDTTIVGTSAMSIDTNSSVTALRITQRGSGDVLRVEDSANVDTTPFIIKTDGKVGIGTANPSELLTVDGNIQTGFLNQKNPSLFPEVQGPNSSYNRYIYTGTGGLVDFLGGLDLVTQNSVVYNFSPNTISAENFDQYFSVSVNPYTVATIEYNGTNYNTTYTQNLYPTRIPSNFIVDGNLGIGTTTPNQKLTVSGNISAVGTHVFEVSSIENNPVLTIKQNSKSSGSFSTATSNGTILNVIGWRAGSYRSLFTITSAHSVEHGYLTNASGRNSFATGQSTVASGEASHAEGVSTQAIGDYSHAEGDTTIARGADSHAEGQNTTADGNQSHAEGYYTIAKGNQSHAAGLFATAAHNNTWIWKGTANTSQLSTTRSGQFMVDAPGGSAFFGNVGIGTDNKDNALTVSGNISASGNVSTNNKFLSAGVDIATLFGFGDAITYSHSNFLPLSGTNSSNNSSAIEGKVLIKGNILGLPRLIVSGSSNSDLNGTYIHTTEINYGFPVFRNTVSNAQIFRNTSAFPVGWYMAGSGGGAYHYTTNDYPIGSWTNIPFVGNGSVTSSTLDPLPFGDLTRSALTVSGNISAQGDLTVTGNLSVLGTTTQIDTTIVGTSAMSIDTNSSETALRITQRGSGDVLRVEDSANPDTTPFIIKTDGKVGIGTASPNEALTVIGNISASGNVEFGSGTTSLYVENSKVGINIENPNEALTVNGNISASGNLIFNSYQFTQEVTTATTDITATNTFLKVIVNGQNKYIRLFDL